MLASSKPDIISREKRKGSDERTYLAYRCIAAVTLVRIDEQPWTFRASHGLRRFRDIERATFVRISSGKHTEQTLTLRRPSACRR